MENRSRDQTDQSCSESGPDNGSLPTCQSDPPTCNPIHELCTDNIDNVRRLSISAKDIDCQIMQADTSVCGSAINDIIDPLVSNTCPNSLKAESAVCTQDLNQSFNEKEGYNVENNGNDNLQGLKKCQVGDCNKGTASGDTGNIREKCSGATLLEGSRDMETSDVIAAKAPRLEPAVFGKAPDQVMDGDEGDVHVSQLRTEDRAPENSEKNGNFVSQLSKTKGNYHVSRDSVGIKNSKPAKKTRGSSVSEKTDSKIVENGETSGETNPDSDPVEGPVKFEGGDDGLPPLGGRLAGFGAPGEEEGMEECDCDECILEGEDARARRAPAKLKKVSLGCRCQLHYGHKYVYMRLVRVSMHPWINKITSTDCYNMTLSLLKKGILQINKQLDMRLYGIAV